MGRHERPSSVVPLGTPLPRKPRGRSRFSQADVARAIRGALKAKLQIAAVRIEPDGTILIIPGTPGPVVSEANPWDA